MLLTNIVYTDLQSNPVPVFVLAYVIAGIFALQGLGLFWLGRQLRRGYVNHAFLGLFWPS